MASLRVLPRSMKRPGVTDSYTVTSTSRLVAAARDPQHRKEAQGHCAPDMTPSDLHRTRSRRGTELGQKLFLLDGRVRTLWNTLDSRPDSSRRNRAQAHLTSASHSQGLARQPATWLVTGSLLLSSTIQQTRAQELHTHSVRWRWVRGLSGWISQIAWIHEVS